MLHPVRFDVVCSFRCDTGEMQGRLGDPISQTGGNQREADAAWFWITNDFVTVLDVLLR